MFPNCMTLSQSYLGPGRLCLSDILKCVEQQSHASCINFLKIKAKNYMKLEDSFKFLFCFRYRSDGTKKDPLKINSMVSTFYKILV